jgi:hypothetical protein
MRLAAAVNVPVPQAASSNREPAQIGRSRPGLEDDVRPFRSWFVCNSEPETKEDTPCRGIWSNAASRTGLSIPVDEGGAKTCQVVVDGNATEGVTWIQSYVTTDKQVAVGPTAWTVRGAAVESPDATGASAPQRHQATSAAA